MSDAVPTTTTTTPTTTATTTPTSPAPAAGRGRARLPRLLSEPMWVLGLVVLVDEIDKNIVRGMITPLKDEFGVGDLGISVMLSLALLFNGLITVPAGYLADRWNRSRAVGRTVVGWSGLSALGATALNFPMLVTLRSALGFGQAITEPSAASLLGDYYPPARRGRAFSIQQVMLLAGTGLGVAIGGGLAAAFNWRVGLLVAALPGLAVALLVFRLREPWRGSADLLAAIGGTIDDPDPHLDPGDDGGGGAADHDDHGPGLFDGGVVRFARDMLVDPRDDMRTIMYIRTMRYALVGVAALLFTETAIASWLPQYYERHLHLDKGAGEAAFGVLAIVAGVPGVPLGGRVADRWAPRLTGGRLALPAIFLFAGTSCFTASYLFRMPAGTTEADWSVVAPAYALQLAGLFIITMAIPGLRAGLTDALPAHLRGAGFGAFNLVSVVAGQAAAPFVVGALGRLRREPAHGLPHRHAVQLLGRRHPVPSPAVPGRRHAEDHAGGPHGPSGGTGPVPGATTRAPIVPQVHSK